MLLCFVDNCQSVSCTLALASRPFLGLTILAGRILGAIKKLDCTAIDSVKIMKYNDPWR